MEGHTHQTQSPSPPDSPQLWETDTEIKQWEALETLCIQYGLKSVMTFTGDQQESADC